MMRPEMTSADMTDRSRPGVMVCRPERMADTLCQRLIDAGIAASALPVIDIETLTPPAEQKQQALDLDRYQGVIFISANAARLGMDYLTGYWPQWPWQLPVLAVGQATAEQLARDGLSALTPEEANSEGLLRLPALQQVTAQRWLIVRGTGGRELLADTLRQRGARVDYLEVYRRQPRTLRTEQLAQLSPGTLMVITSRDIGEALLTQLAAATIDPATLAWCVISPRLLDWLRSMGLQAACVTPSASDQDLFTAIHNWRAGSRSV